MERNAERIVKQLREKASTSSYKGLLFDASTLIVYQAAEIERQREVLLSRSRQLADAGNALAASQRRERAAVECIVMIERDLRRDQPATAMFRIAEWKRGPEAGKEENHAD